MAFIDIERFIQSQDISTILHIMEKYRMMKFDVKWGGYVLGNSPFVQAFLKITRRKSSMGEIFRRVVSICQLRINTAAELKRESEAIISAVCLSYFQGNIYFSVYFLLHMLIITTFDKAISVKNVRFNPFKVITVSQKVLDWTSQIWSTYPLEPDSFLVDGFNPLFLTPNGFGVFKGRSSVLYPISRSCDPKTNDFEYEMLKKTIALIDLGIAVVVDSQLTLSTKAQAVFDEVDRSDEQEENEWWVRGFVRLQPVGVGRKEIALVPVKGHFRHRAA